MNILSKLRFHRGYFGLTFRLFILEVIIAKFATGWIRAYIGDVLVVILIYVAVMTVLNINKRLAVLGTLVFAFVIEFSQYFKLAALLGFTPGSLGYIVIGNTFSIEDLVCYSLGCLIILAVERRVGAKKRNCIINTKS